MGNQVLDSANDWSCRQNPSTCYSQVGLFPGEYAGVGCIGEACLYYQIGCFQGCATCSLEGKDLYPTQADLHSAGCREPPAPTLGGGDPVKEHALRTHNIDDASPMGDWTRWFP